MEDIRCIEDMTLAELKYEYDICNRDMELAIECNSRDYEAYHRSIEIKKRIEQLKDK